MVSRHHVSHRSHRSASLSDRVTRGLRPVLDGVVLLLSAVTLTALLVVALVWMLRTLGLVLG